MKNCWNSFTILIVLLCSTLFVNAQQLNISDYSTTEDYQAAKQLAIGTKPVQSQNHQHPSTYPNVNNSVEQRSISSCWYPTDGTFTTLAENGTEVVTLDGGSMDDGYWGPIALPFTYTLYGVGYTDLYINTNGNVSFGGGFTAYTASGFPEATAPAMIAPFWSDVDLRSAAISNKLSYKIETGGGMDRIIITWEQVGYWLQNSVPDNTFQLILTDGNDPILGVGNNAQFAYGDMNWAVGDVSGANGFGAGAYGTAGAQANAGANYYQIGLFEFDDATYDGPVGANDGIHYLDSTCFITDISGLNTPPIANGFPSSTVNLCAGSTYNLSVSFSAPEVAQTTSTVVTNGTANVANWSTTINDGNLSTVDFSFTPDAGDVGSHTFTFTSTDDGAPIESTVETVTINVIAAPSPTITGDLDYCAGGSTTLDAGGGYVSYLWSPNSETTQTAVAAAAGNYTVTVDDGTCTGSTMVTVTENALPTPTITPGGPTTFCDGGSVSLDAGAGYSAYAWTPNSETSQSVSASASGTWTVTVTDGNGCQGSDNEVITVNSLPTPTITPDGPATFCDGGTVNLDAGNGYAGYAWTPNSESTQTINVTTSGTYGVTVTDGNGCQGTTNQVVTVNSNPTPTITPGGATTFCDGGSVSLDAGGGYAGYAWTPNSETTQAVSAAASGTWTVTVTDGNGCQGSDSEVITVNSNPTASITPSGATTFCDGGSVDLIASGAGGGTYSWSPTSETTPTITVSTSGTHTVTVTDLNGCTDTANETVTVNSNPTPSITPDGPTTFCDGSSVNLDAGAYTSYLWTTGSETTQTINVTTSGNYEVTVTDANGCTGTDTESITVNSNPTATIAGSTSYCTGFSSTLDAGAGYSAYSWSTGATTQTINATTADNPITVTVTDGNGCTDTSAPVTLTENTALTPIVTGATEYCAGSNTTLDAGAGYVSYSWTPNSETTQTITATAGTYTVTVVDGNGCSGTSANVAVSVCAEPPEDHT